MEETDRDSTEEPYPISVSYGSGSGELNECLRDFIEAYGEDVDPKDVWESVTKVHGFDVDFETVKTEMDSLRKGKKVNSCNDAEGDTEKNVHVSYYNIPQIDPSQTLGRRKVKLTEDILKIVSNTLDEEDVHSLLSLKRALELKGVHISKTSVYRALEKLGRSIVEKKKKPAPRVTVTVPKTSPKPVKVGPRTVAEMLAKQKRKVAPGTSQPAPVIVTSDGKAMILAKNQHQPLKKLRALLPKPTSSMNNSPKPILATTASTFGSNDVFSAVQQSEKRGRGLMQIKKEARATSSPMTAVGSTAVIRTQQVLTLRGTPSIASTIISSTAPPLASSTAVSASVVTNTESKQKNIEDNPDPVIKIEIDDPSDPEAYITIMNTGTPPPRTSDQHSSENFHHSERLTKSVSPQLMSSSYDTYARLEKDAKGRAVQQFRLNKAIGKITNMRSQGQAARAPRKPSVVFHRPSSNSTPIPFRVRHEPSFAKTSQQEGRKPGHSLHSQSNGRNSNQFKARSTSRPSQRTLQMMRAARNAQLRSLMRNGLHKLHPTALSNGRVVNAMTNNRRRLTTRLQRHEMVSPLYYQSDLDEDDFLTELEIDPPDNYGVSDELRPSPEERQETPDNVGENSELLRDMFQEMMKEMRRFSQHMETIQGQLQLIVEQMPTFVHQQRSGIEVRHLTTNGHTQHMEVSSPLSNDDHSPDTVDDTDDNATENNQESPLGSTRESMEIPTLGTPESDALIREVLDDVRWDQMTPYAGAPRLAIALARYCIFGTKVLMESSVTGRNSKNPLNNLAMKKIKELLREKYGSRCNQLEFEMVWKTSRESISQLCKRLRRKFQMTGRVGGGQEDFILDCRQ